MEKLSIRSLRSFASNSKNRQTIRFLISVFILVIITGAASVYHSQKIVKLEYSEHLEETVLTVDKTDYKLRDLAFYIAYQESTVEEQAHIYEASNTNKYWNLHTNYSFIRNQARNAAMDMAIHDVIFYQMALQDNIELDQKEQTYMNNQKDDFWNDLTEEQQEKICVSRKEIDEMIYRIALAQKEQKYLAGREGIDEREYNVEGSVYQELLKEHDYQINQDLWERLKFGNITISH